MTESINTVLILGASGAVGSRFAQRFLAAGTNVIGTASNQGALAKIPIGVSEQYVLDLTDSKQINAVCEAIKENHSAISGVIVASGVVGFAGLEDSDADLVSKMMRINHLGPAQVVSELFSIIATNQVPNSYVLGMTGVVVEQTFPGMSAYTASKVAHSAFLASVGKEWRRYKVTAIDVRLGHTETGLANHPLFGQAPNMPTGFDPDHALDVIMTGITNRVSVINSTEF
ncbi:MAG: SDR family oxidoreductase [Actinomycetes bacterium]